MDQQQWPTDRNKPGQRKVQNPEGLVKEEEGGRHCLRPREELAPQGRQRVKWQKHQPDRGTPGLLCKLKSVKVIFPCKFSYVSLHFFEKLISKNKSIQERLLSNVNTKIRT